MKILFLRVVASSEEVIHQFFDTLKETFVVFENTGIKPTDNNEFRGYCTVSVERKDATEKKGPEGE
jgi:hypothetical protein